ncbi:MAG: family 43 glycosylhydrolase [Clostridia bacterium]|nr:family 43 glycosylhydrolase [Clostridia bacterium]
MKKLLYFITVLTLSIFCVCIASAASPVVFVSDAGDNMNSGASAEAPLKTLGAAYDRFGADGGTVVVCGKLTLADDALKMPQNDGWVTFTSKWDGVDYAKTDSASLNLSGYTYLGGNTEFRDITINDASPFYFNFILCRGHSLTVGEEVTCTDGYGLYFTIYGGTLVNSNIGTAAASFYDYTITVDSGTWYGIYGGNKRADTTAAAMGATGDVRIIINGGSYLGKAANQADAMITPGGMNAQDGDYYLEINDGIFNCPIYALQRPGDNSLRYTAYYDGDVSIVINGGTFNGAVISTTQNEEASWVGGNYSLEIYGGSFNALESISAPRVKGKAVCKIVGSAVDNVVVSDFDSMGGEFPEKSVVPLVRASEGVVFVGGRNDGDGSTSQLPMPSLGAAVKALGESGGTIVVCAPLRVDTETLAAYDNLKITSVYGGIDFQKETGAKLELVNYIVLGGKTEFCNITLESRGLTSMILCAGHKTLFGDGITGTRHMDGGITEYISIYGCDRLQSNAPELPGKAASDVTIKSGDFENVVLGNYRVHGGINSFRTTVGENNLEISGGCFHGAIKAVGMNHHEGNSTVNITGGKFLCSIYGIATPVNIDPDCNTVNGNVYININGGEYHGEIHAVERNDRTYLNGEFCLTVNSGDLRCVGEIRGCEDVWGDNTATIGGSYDFDAECTGTSTFQNPTVDVGADPSVCYHDGWYYYVTVKYVGNYQAIAISRSPNLADIASAKFVNVYVLDKDSPVQSIWAPQLKNFDGKWYLYFTGASAENAGVQRMPYTMTALGDTPFDGFTAPKMFENLDSSIYSWLAPRPFEHNGELYYCSSVFVEASDNTSGNHKQKLAIAKLESPTKFATGVSIIAVPDKSFEAYDIMEGPYAVYAEDGKSLCLIYCANYADGEDYCTGLLTFSGGDILSMENWEKLPAPIGARDSNYEIFAPGATLFAPMPDGSIYAIYHVKLHAMNRYNRSIFIQPVGYKNGLPYLGAPPPLETVFEYSVNPMPVSERIFGFDTKSEFKAIRTYNDNFTDVTSDKWFAPFVKTAYEYALANGTSATKFSPDGKFTVAQALTAAANIHTVYYGNNVRSAVSGEAWYVPYVEYCVQNGIITEGQFADLNANITRGDMAIVFANILPDSEYEIVKDGAASDVTSDMACYNAVSKLYKAGIVSGDAGKGTYRPHDEIVRSEACVIFTRIALKSERVK